MMLDDIPLALRENIFLQDGALVHNAHIVYNYINAHFQN